MPDMPNKMKSDNNNKKEDGRFKKKNVKHDPQAESTRATFDAPPWVKDHDLG